MNKDTTPTTNRRNVLAGLAAGVTLPLAGPTSPQAVADPLDGLDVDDLRQHLARAESAIARAKRALVALPPTEAATLHPDQLLPDAWQGWRSLCEMSTVGDLLLTMNCEAWDETDGRDTQDDAEAAGFAIGRALDLGYALGMTREHAAEGPEAWYQAAFAYAGLRVRENGDA